MPVAAQNLELAKLVSQFYDDPYGFVVNCYPWGEKGELEITHGPDAWQREFLHDLSVGCKARQFDGHTAVAPLRFAVASGHGIGKSTLSAWLVDWIMSTRPHAQGTITANTYTQLETKTWAQITRWTKLCITGHWFELQGRRMFHKESEKSWFCTPQTCAAENSEAFAGQHAKESTSFYIFDEASAVPDKTWEVAEGGLTDGEPMIFCFGNPTRNTGKFHRIAFGRDRHLWNHRSVDSRDSAFTNKETIAEWIREYGEDSDFVRVRVKGQPPFADELQFIPGDLVERAQRHQPLTLPNEPLVAGVDVSGGGAAWNVCRFRRGADARTLPPIRVPGEHGRDRQLMITRLAEVLSDRRPDHRVAMMFVDSAFGAPIVERLHMLGFENVIEVNFGGRSADEHQANTRAYMWNRLKEWLETGAIDPNDERLEIDLTGPGYHVNKNNQLVIEPKEHMAKRGVASPDDGDALALTFAQPVAPVIAPQQPERRRGLAGNPDAWMG